MEKQQVKETLEFLSSGTYSLKELYEKYKDCVLYVEDEEEGYCVYLYKIRDETDEEYTKRINKEKEYKLLLEQKKYETYLRLKKEFEKTS